MNNNIPYGNDGVQPMNHSNVREEFTAQELQDAQAPIESTQPALNRNLNQPGVNYGTSTPDSREGGYSLQEQKGYVQGGTVLTDNIYELNDTGVHQVHSYSVNTSRTNIDISSNAFRIGKS